VNGKTIFKDGEILGQAGDGQFVRSNPANISKEF
jgi:hypothetical protein